jgi:hypothetical protein
MSYLVVRKRDPRTDEPPCDGTQIVYGFKEGVVLAGDAHWAWQEPSDADEPDFEVDPDIVWWFNAERDLEDVPPQLLADLRTLASLPDDLALSFADPRLRYADVQVDLDLWEEAKAAAARVREWLSERGNV